MTIQMTKREASILADFIEAGQFGSVAIKGVASSLRGCVRAAGKTGASVTLNIEGPDDREALASAGIEEEP